MNGDAGIVQDRLRQRGSFESDQIDVDTAGSQGTGVVCALAAPEGIRRLEDSGLPLRVVTAAIDERLNDSGFIVPGLGDAGDRQYGAV